MGYAVECFFNKETTNIINNFISILKTNDITTDDILRPHISLAVYDNIEMNYFLEKLKIFSTKINKLKITLSNFDIFSSEKSVLYLATKYSEELYKIHEIFHNDFKEFSENEWDYYIPKNWIPHCSLAIDMTQEMICKSFKYVHEIKLPIELTIEKIGLIEFRPAKEIACYHIF